MFYRENPSLFGRFPLHGRPFYRYLCNVKSLKRIDYEKDVDNNNESYADSAHHGTVRTSQNDDW